MLFRGDILLVLRNRNQIKKDTNHTLLHVQTRSKSSEAALNALSYFSLKLHHVRRVGLNCVITCINVSIIAKSAFYL